MPSTSDLTRAKSKSQKSLESFFGKPAASADSGKVLRRNNSNGGMEGVEPVGESSGSGAKSKGKKKAVKGSSVENSHLPPIHDIPAIFSDIVSRVPEIKDVTEHLRGRKIRVATMCSGTESPLLALDLIRRYIIQHYGVPLEVEHVFSCEIEPFKQAYIERNFRPSLLFRDVCELGEDEA